jgi:hypothetical protein
MTIGRAEKGLSLTADVFDQCGGKQAFLWENVAFLACLKGFWRQAGVVWRKEIAIYAELLRKKVSFLRTIVGK